jgi:hypothetical protein
VHLEASTKPHVHQKLQIFWTNIAFTMACPNFKNGPKNGLGPLGVNILYTSSGLATTNPNNILCASSRADNCPPIGHILHPKLGRRLPTLRIQCPLQVGLATANLYNNFIVPRAIGNHHFQKHHVDIQCGWLATANAKNMFYTPHGSGGRQPKNI